MRVLLTADPELPVPPRLYGGIERVVDALVRELIRRGHAVGLVARPDSGCPADELFPWPGADSRSPADTARNALALRRAVRAFRPDVLHSFSRLAYLAGLLPARLPKVMSYQRAPSSRTVAWAARLGGRSLAFTGCSGWIAAAGRAAGGAWHAIPNFVEPGRFTFVPAVPADAPLVFLSRVERIKGAHTAIAIAEAAGRRLAIAGNRPDSAGATAYWDDEIAPHLGRDGIEYVGPVDDARKDALLGSAAALVVPIEWEEPFGIVFAEALACGTPVISSPRGALPEIVEPGRTGFLIASVAEGADAVARLGELDRAACRGRAEGEFSTGAVVGRYEALYRSLPGGRE